ncbi:MAG: hypothetical protein EOO31_07975 [Comamonadaceae bacterium]|nr:MAG: hypothetical protein EOO31_07975 [Comamonadaceae bacterium]
MVKTGNAWWRGHGGTVYVMHHVKQSRETAHIQRIPPSTLPTMADTLPLPMPLPTLRSRSIQSKSKSTTTKREVSDPKYSPSLVSTASSDSLEEQEKKYDDPFPDFQWMTTEEPHRSRRMAILKAHPEVSRIV